MTNPLELSELLITKMSHDLSASIGAVYNGVEFIEAEGKDINDDPSFKLIAQNALISTNKIRMFRMMLGRSDHNSEIDIEKVRQCVDDYFQDTKISCTFENENTGEEYIQITALASKLLLVILQIVSSTMIHGGNINIKLARSEDGKSITISGTSGGQIKADKDLDILKKGHVDIALSNVYIHLAKTLAEKLGVKIQTTTGDKEITMQFHFNKR